MKILSFNIWDLPLFFVKDRRKRVLGTIKYLKGLDADVVCLQESFDMEHRKMFFEALRDKYHFSGGMSDSRRILFLKLFDKTGGLLTLSKFPIKKSRFVPYNRLLNSALGEVFARKGFLETILEAPEGELRVVNTHLHEEAIVFDRKVRLRQLKRIFRDMGGSIMPAVLVGDLNQDAIEHQEDFAELFESLGFEHPKLLGENEHTYRPENPYVDNWVNRTKTPKRFDYILVRGLQDLGLKTSDYAPQHLPTALSDHDPILLTLTSSGK